MLIGLIEVTRAIRFSLTAPTIPETPVSEVSHDSLNSGNGAERTFAALPHHQDQ
jgi:hypothetical protein